MRSVEDERAELPSGAYLAPPSERGDPASKGGRFGKAPAHLERSPSNPMGYMITTGPVGVEAEGETLMCVHCQYHWIVQPGSGHKRGFCFRCAGPTCGKKVCMEKCIPFEKAIEGMEAKGRLAEAMERTRQL